MPDSQSSSPSQVSSASHTHTFSHGFPPWLQQLCYFGGIIVAIVLFGANIRSDQRSTREELSRLVNDVTVIRSSLPNKEVYEVRFSDINTQLARIEQRLNVNDMLAQKLREDLLKKGVID